MIDELETLRDWSPPGADADPSAAARARARLDAHIAAAAPAPAAVATGRRRRPRWWLVVAPPALGAAVAAAILLSLGSGVQEGRVTPATADAALEHAARAAERQPAADVFPRPDQFFYTRSQGTQLSCMQTGQDAMACALTTMEREAWLSQRETGRVRSHATGVRWPSDADRDRWIAAGRPSMSAGRDLDESLDASGQYGLGNERLSYEQMVGFDQSPEALYRRLHDGVQAKQGKSVDDEVFTQIGDALREQPAPPALRAALYRALKLVPGVEYLGAVHDRLGRPAVGVARTEKGTRRELLFDPDTSEMLAERAVTTEARGGGIDVPVGTAIEDVVYERRAVVDQVGSRP